MVVHNTCSTADCSETYCSARAVRFCSSCRKKRETEQARVRVEKKRALDAAKEEEEAKIPRMQMIPMYLCSLKILKMICKAVKIEDVEDEEFCYNFVNHAHHINARSFMPADPVWQQLHDASQNWRASAPNVKYVAWLPNKNYIIFKDVLRATELPLLAKKLREFCVDPHIGNTTWNSYWKHVIEDKDGYLGDRYYYSGSLRDAGHYMGWLHRELQRKFIDPILAYFPRHESYRVTPMFSIGKESARPGVQQGWLLYCLIFFMCHVYLLINNDNSMAF